MPGVAPLPHHAVLDGGIGGDRDLRRRRLRAEPIVEDERGLRLKADRTAAGVDAHEGAELQAERVRDRLGIATGYAERFSHARSPDRIRDGRLKGQRRHV